LRLPKQADAILKTALQAFQRQALHAAQLGLVHPVTGEYLQWQVPLPDDMQQLLQALKTHDEGAG
jgi:23S rRNA pseudouridine1911/1915/1917 synthase